MGERRTTEDPRRSYTGQTAAGTSKRRIIIPVQEGLKLFRYFLAHLVDDLWDSTIHRISRPLSICSSKTNDLVVCESFHVAEVAIALGW